MSWLRDVDRWLCEEVLPYQGTYLAVARRITNSGDAARDIVQDAYAEVLDGEGWRAAVNPKAFMARVVYCRALNWVNRQKIVPMRNMPALELFLDEHGPDAFEILSGKEELAAVLEALDALPLRCRQVVTMRRLEDLSPSEIARRLGIAVDTVDRHLARGLNMLSDTLGDRMSRRRRKGGKPKQVSQAE